MKEIATRLNFEKVGVLPENGKTPEQITFDWIVGAVSLAHPNGLPYLEQRVLYNALNKIEVAHKAASPTVELEDAEYQLLKEAVSDAKFQVSNMRVANLLYDMCGLE